MWLRFLFSPMSAIEDLYEPEVNVAEVPVLLHVYCEGEGLERVDAAEVVGGEDDRVQLGHNLRQDLKTLQQSTMQFKVQIAEKN